MYLTDDQVKNKLHEGEIETVILNYIDFTLYLADRVARKSWSHEQKDIRGVALLALVEGVQSLKGHDNPRGFLTLKIRGAIMNYVCREHTVYTPQNKKPYEKNLYLEDIDKENGEIPKQCWEGFDPEDNILANSITGSFLFSDIEKKIIRLSIEGYTLEEIAAKTGLLYIQVQRIRKGTRDRVVNILNGEY